MIYEPQNILEYFFYFGDPSLSEKGTYIPYLVVLSYVIASLGSFTGLRLATEIQKAETEKLKSVLHFGGAFAFGVGIWSMHFIGMLAYDMEMVVSYDLFLTVMSMIIAVVIAYGVLEVVRSGSLGFFRLLVSAVLLGAAICGMHYTGMAAMEMDGNIYYIPWLFVLSLVIAVTASGAALWIVFKLGQHSGHGKIFWQIVAAMVMGAAICGMHYTGMEASVFIPWAECRYDPDQRFDTLALVVALTSSIIFTIAITLSLSKEVETKEKVTKGIYSGDTVFLHLSGLLSFFLILLVGSYMFLNHHSIKQQDDGATLNAAALQRMLITRYVYHVSAIISVHDTGNENELIKTSQAVQQDQRVVEANYDGLLRSGLVVLNAKENRQETVAVISNPEIREKLQVAQREWEVLKNITKNIIHDEKTPHAADSHGHVHELDYESLENQLVVTLQAQDEAVFAIEKYYEEKNQSLIFKQQIVLGLGIFVFLLSLFYARYVIANAIERSRIRLSQHQENLKEMVRERTKELVQAKEEAEAASRTKDDFLANMSHELRTPLNSILGLTKISLEDEDLSTELRENLTIIDKASVSLLETVNNVLDLSKIEAGVVELDKKPFSIAELLFSLIDQVRPLSSKKGLILRHNVDDISHLYLMGDEFRLSRILMNLMSNAIKYTLTGEINLTSRLQTAEDGADIADDEVLFIFEVKDTGIGIEEDKIERIFDKFSQADGTIERKFGGTGLGLSITKYLTEMMGGSIKVESRVNEGSTFTVSIPFKRIEKEESEAHEDLHEAFELPEVDEKIPAGKAQILVAEDHEFNQKFIIKLLKKLGFENFKIVGNGKEALMAFDETPYDIVLMDVHMPEMNGYDASSAIRQKQRVRDLGEHTPVIAMTADVMPETRDRCLRAGMDEYISKPIDADTFERLMSHWFTFETTFAGSSVPSDSNRETGPADLSLLREYSDGDEELEKEMIRTFYDKSLEHLKVMEANQSKMNHEEWSEAAHALKGSSGYIGAQRLVELCHQAQEMKEALREEREKQLAAILSEHEKVVIYLQERNLL
jgi:signal transduction histidine kinase/NO-binding membrane sensor protein with MHYT domain/CheY-like chemotaxis protein